MRAAARAGAAAASAGGGGGAGRGCGPIPPSSPAAGSGVWRTAQRTIMNRPTIGIFRKTISQRKVHVVHCIDRIPAVRSVQPPVAIRPDGPSSCLRWRVSRAAQRGAAELGHRLQFLDARDDLAAGQPLDALGAELLDVEGGEHGGMGHRAAQQIVGELLLGVGGDVADEPAREGVAGAGRVDTVSSG